MVYIGFLNELFFFLKLYIVWLVLMVIIKGSFIYLIKIVFYFGYLSCLIFFFVILGLFFIYFNVFFFLVVLVVVVLFFLLVEFELVNF